MIDANGLPIVLKLRGSGTRRPQRRRQAGRYRRGPILLADRADDSDNLRSDLAERSAWADVRRTPDRKRRSAFSAFLYRRYLVERFLGELKHFRAVSIRYDKDANNFLAAVQLAAMRIWIRPK